MNYVTTEAWSQKRTRRIRDDSDDEYRGASSSQRIKTDPGSTNWDAEAFQRKVKDTVRYALACEYKRVPIRRDEINKKILQERSRDFNRVQADVQRRLKHLFGFEMVELPPKERPTLDNNKGKATTKAGSTTKTYVLCNSLENAYRTPELIHRSDEETELHGLLYVVLALIFTNEQIMSEVDLFEHLDRLGVIDDSQTFGDREKVLDSFVKLNYLVRSKTGTDPNNESGREYYWGPRAKAEVTDEDIIGFIVSTYGSDVNEETMKDYIYRAAGYDLRLEPPI
ncbi:MAGE family-domain-containing protein [Zychaea mexicana]|uniref:MAGE family-domain-containing protein n=1 Tax=Zychaea mexicana TaxID=64656 RepID=UPI0022FDDF3C|nr:MAGE family-domain-containing protein [Zychaea mexicana]KAI9494644.1 MAGE family-domain-containing protein [Zychaea mexicana]